MDSDLELMTLDGIALPKLGGLQKEHVLDLANQIRSKVLSLEKDKLDIGLKMAELYDIVGHGCFERVRKKFFPEISERSAQRYTAIGRRFGQHREIVRCIGFSNLGKLAEDAKLSSLQSELIEQIKRGDTPDAQSYRARIKAITEGAEIPLEGKVELINGDPGTSQGCKSQGKSFYSEGKISQRVANMDEIEDLIDIMVPNTLVDQHKLEDMLSTSHSRRCFTTRLSKRVSDLIRNRAPEPDDSTPNENHEPAA